jgi:indole-3-glycerol phosphate synthase
MDGEPVPSADELNKLQRQLETAIEMVERGDIVIMSERERIEHIRRFGVDAFLIGDFVITRRKGIK